MKYGQVKLDTNTCQANGPSKENGRHHCIKIDESSYNVTFI